MTTRLDISIGPVQGFVAQSRRTRDLWGSSYLLSFLSAHAMHGAEREGAKIVRPLVANDVLYRWVSGSREGQAPKIGSLPNHFVVEVDENAGDMACAARKAFQAAWTQVHEAVWDEFLKPVESAGLDTQSIWRRQVSGFWEMTWATTPCSSGKTENGGSLARRKRWRSHQPTVEPGDKCTIMHDLQELSGYVRAEGRQSRESQDRFWSDLSKRLGTLDLRPNERLCAVALVKRMFAQVSREALGWEVDRSRWSSTVYVAAVPWIERVARAVPDLAAAYSEAVEKHAAGSVFAEQPPPAIGGLEIGQFARLDANWLHAESVKYDDRCPLAGDDATVRGELAGKLEVIAKQTDHSGRPIGTPSLYYGLLLADGDRLGKLVGERGSDSVGRALAHFTGRVEDIVKKHHGVTAYAGGDDVMAMLPLSEALACADKLSESYRKAFGTDPETGANATLSAAVVFAHGRFPLSSVLREAHRLLNDVAKDGNGRNSLAASVLKPGGLHCQWTTTWMRNGTRTPVAALQLLGDLVGQLKIAAVEPGLSSGLIYRARETLTMLCGWNRWKPGKWGRVARDLDLRAFLRAEIARSFADHHIRDAEGESTTTRMAKRTDTISTLVCDLIKRSPAPSAEVQDADAREVGIDALLLGRFLADDGHESAAR